MNNMALWQPFVISGSNLRHGYRARFTGESRIADAPGMPVQVYYEEDEIVIQAVVPGVDKSDMEVTLSERLVTIEVKKDRAISDSSETEHVGEGQEVVMKRDVRLVEDVDTDRSKSHLEKGILEIRLAKSLKSQPTKLEITG